MRVLIFDIWAPFGHFRVPYTTTSPLTYPIPTKTAVAGMISAIIGIDKNEYLKYFDSESFKIGIRIIESIKMTHINENFINVKEVSFFARWKEGKNPRTQINVEFLKDCKYRLYIYHNNEELYQKLKTNLENHQSVYSVCMGLSECLANFNYVCESELQQKRSNSEEIKVNSVVPLSKIRRDSILISSEGMKYVKIHIPIELSEDRTLKKTEDLLIEKDGKSIPLKNIEYFEVVTKEGTENIILF